MNFPQHQTTPIQPLNHKKRPNPSTSEPNSSSSSTGSGNSEPAAKRIRPRVVAVSDLTTNEKNVLSVLKSLSSYPTLLPPSVIEAIVAKSGFTTRDKRLYKLIAAATQLLTVILAQGSLDYHRIRNLKGHRKIMNESTMVMKIDDLQRALDEYGLKIAKDVPLFAFDNQDSESASSSVPSDGDVPSTTSSDDKDGGSSSATSTSDVTNSKDK
eukprot:g3773.t1